MLREVQHKRFVSFSGSDEMFQKRSPVHSEVKLFFPKSVTMFHVYQILLPCHSQATSERLLVARAAAVPAPLTCS